MDDKKQINFGIDDGKEFFAHEMSVNFNPTQFIFDFRCITPRIDPRANNAPYISIKHNVVLAEPWHAKEMLRVLGNVIKSYESEFGEIKKPKAVVEYEKKANKIIKNDKQETQAPNYFG